LAKTIGTGVGRDYATVKAYLDAMPADLTAEAAGAWDGEFYNDGGVIPLDQTTAYSKTVTTDASHPLQWYAATGESIFDDTDNPMDYDATAGVAVEGSVGSGILITLTTAYFNLDGVQFRNTSTSSFGALKITNATGSVQRCIFAGGEYTVNYGTLTVTGTGALEVFNNLFVNIKATPVGSGLNIAASGTTVYNNTFTVRGTTSSTRGIDEVVNAHIFNCAFFNLNTGVRLSLNQNLNIDHCATDLTLLGNKAYTTPSAHDDSTNLLEVAFTADTFVNVTSGSEDYNLAAASDLIDAGTSSGTPTTDAYGRTRSTNDIGASEYVAGGAGTEVTGSGAAEAGASTAEGTGTRTVVGTGEAASGAATAEGSGVRTVTGTGAATVAAASAEGVGTRAIVGSGAVSSAAAAAEGAGVRGVTGTGAAVAGEATAEGAGTAIRTITGTGEAVAGSASAEGVGVRGVTGSGEAAAGDAEVSGSDAQEEQPVVGVDGGGVRRSRRRKGADRPSSVPYSEKNADDLARRIREAREPAPVEAPEPKAKPAPKLVEADAAADRAAEVARQAAAQEFAREVEATITPEMLALAAATQHFAVDKSETTKSMVSNADEEAIIALLLAA
jgi:hypothetical protein